MASSQKRKRIVAAWVCLFAAMALYAPLAGAAWSAHAMLCCTGGDYCPIAAHHHHQKNQAPQRSEMDCGHDMGLSEMTNCSMSCCQGSEQPLVTAVAFVLPDVVFATIAAAVTGAADTLHAIEIPRSLQPLSPPPRFDFAS